MANYATPTNVRAVTSYPARRSYKPAKIDPSADHINGVEGAIDLHCHATEKQQDAFGVAKLASKSGMRGILYKSIHGKDRIESVRQLQRDLDAWAQEKGIKPILCLPGRHVSEGYMKPIRAEHARNLLDNGAVALWMPNVNSARTLAMVGGRPFLWDKTADPKAHTEPLPWDEALRVGLYLLDEKGKMKPDVEEIFRMAHDLGRAIFFGHPTPQEFQAMAELCHKLGYTRGVIDHPFSPFVDLTIEQMKQAASIGLWLNFTYDEISPMLGVDPARMYEAIRTIGPEHCTLSSDCGEPLFPNSVEGMRMLAGHMAAFGCSADEIRMMAATNPAFICGLDSVA